ncbi:alpha/beta hydrolase [Mycobacterium sp. CBMA226]|nr:alpha/beta hydrolase [Mycolicibacterium sp. CBMA 226]
MRNTGYDQEIRRGRRQCVRYRHRRRSPQSVAIDTMCRVFVKNAVRIWALQPNLHWPFTSIDQVAALAPLPSSARVQRVHLPSCPAELISTAGSSARRAILYLHGGAFLTCGLNTHRSLAARLSSSADAEVLNVGYRMLPAHGLSAALSDAVDGLRWLLRRGYRWSDIVVAGDSAGGYLALQTAAELLRQGHPPTAGVAAISPLTTLKPLDKSPGRNDRCAMFTARAMTSFMRYIAAHGEKNPSGHRISSPVDADLRRMPPVTIHVSSDEFLRPDAELMYERLTDAGAQCDLHMWDGQIHDFPLAAAVLPEGRRAIRYIGDFVKQVAPASDESLDAQEYPPAASQ